MKTTETSTVKEPLIHITKRNGVPFWKSALIRLVAILAALFLCSILTVAITGLNPLEVFGSMFEGAFGSKNKLWVTVRDIAVLLCISLAVTPAFRMRFWNIGAEGQVLAGGIACAACMILFGGGPNSIADLPDALLILMMFVSSVILGALWGLLPAVCKALWNTNETLFTLMMNYVAMQLIAFLMTKWE